MKKEEQEIHELIESYRMYFKNMLDNFSFMDLLEKEVCPIDFLANTVIVLENEVQSLKKFELSNETFFTHNEKAKDKLEFLILDIEKEVLFLDEVITHSTKAPFLHMASEEEIRLTNKILFRDFPIKIKAAVIFYEQFDINLLPILFIEDKSKIFCLCEN